MSPKDMSRLQIMCFGRRFIGLHGRLCVPWSIVNIVDVVFLLLDFRDVIQSTHRLHSLSLLPLFIPSCYYSLGSAPSFHSPFSCLSLSYHLSPLSHDPQIYSSTYPLALPPSLSSTLNAIFLFHRLQPPSPTSFSLSPATHAATILPGLGGCIQR